MGYQLAGHHWLQHLISAKADANKNNSGPEFLRRWSAVQAA